MALVRVPFADKPRAMPTVLFVNEHRRIDVEAGRLLSEVADEIGVQVCREEFAGTGIGDYTVWIEAADGAVSPPTFYERVFKRCKGWRRMANKTRVLGDVKVYTQQGLGSRASVPRPVSPPPNPSDDPSAARFDHEHDAAGTAWNVYGHPKAVGRGTREAPRYEPPKKEKAKKEPKPPPEQEAATTVAESPQGKASQAKRAAEAISSELESEET
jgi:hypothetical protein